MSSSQKMSASAEYEIRPRSSDGPAPLSFAQELLWLLDRASPGVSAWNVPRAFVLRGSLDVAALQQALDAIVARHEALRTVFSTTDDGPRQNVSASARVDCPVVDLMSEPVEQRQIECDRLVREHALAPFDLTSDTLFRALLVRLDANTHVLCLNSHHIVSDGWSKGILFRELSAYYNGVHRGVPIALEPLPIQFADYATWERDALHDEALAEDAAYWRATLAGAPTSLAIPTDYARSESPRFDAGVRVTVLPRPLVQRLQDVARANGATRYMALLAGYAALLARYSGQDDVVIGSPIAGRSQSETEGLIGYFANTLVLRTRLNGDPTFAQLLARVRDAALDAYDHQAMPFDKLALELRQGRQMTHAPLIQAVLTMEDTLPAVLELDDLSVEPIPLAEGATKFDLTMLVAEQADGLRVSLWYRASLFAAETVDRMLAHFHALLESAVDDPDAPVASLRLTADAELRALLAEGVGAAITTDFEPVTHRIERAAAAMPTVVAVRNGDDVITYAELDARANRLANHLLAHCADPASVIAICMDRSVEMIVALVAVLKAGCAYLPIVPDSPRARIQQQLEEGDVRIVITQETYRPSIARAGIAVVCLDGDAALIASAPATPPHVAVDQTTPAYVLFTSGSTGVPKGVIVTHGNLAAYVAGITARLAVPDANATTTPWHWGLAARWGADLGNTVLFPALTTGGTLHVLPGAVTTEPAAFAAYCVERPLDVLKLTPNHWMALTNALSGASAEAVLPRRWLIVGGEALATRVAQPLAAVLSSIGSRLLNHYGPTETTVGVTTYEVMSEAPRDGRSEPLGATVPIGRPLPGVGLAVLDATAQLVPVGVPGELYVTGPQVAQGYLGQPALTADRFVTPGAMDGARAYRTGDRVRWRGDGTLEFLGRVDAGQQVKIRGYRVELGEIEAVLSMHPAVARAAVLAMTEDGDTGAASSAPSLAACVVRRTGPTHTEASCTAQSLAAWLEERLPAYMVPSHTAFLDAVPLTDNGKLDRNALEMHVRREIERAGTVVGGGSDAAASGASSQSSTDTERAIIAIWEDALKRMPIGVRDNFFALGGHSLVAIRVLGKISKQFGVRLPLRTLFEAPTVADVAATIDAEIAEVRRRELDDVLASLAGMSDAEVTRSMHRAVGRDPE